MSELTIAQRREGSTLLVSLKGRMAEAADYSAVRCDGAKAVEFDFEGVSLINSKGIQIWKNFMISLPPSLAIRYARCTLKVVNQLNLFPSFSGNRLVDIVSFYAPYACDGCDATVQVLFETTKVFPDRRAVAVPAATCKGCGQAMELDANPQKYFMFLRRPG